MSTVPGPWTDLPEQQVTLRYDASFDRDVGALQHILESTINRNILPAHVPYNHWAISWDDMRQPNLSATTVYADGVGGGGVVAGIGTGWEVTITVGGAPTALVYVVGGKLAFLGLVPDRFDQRLTDHGPVTSSEVDTLLAEHPDWDIEFELTPGSGVPADPYYLAQGFVPVDGLGIPASGLQAMIFFESFISVADLGPPLDWNTAGLAAYGPLIPHVDYDGIPSGTHGLGMVEIHGPWPVGGGWGAPELGRTTYADVQANHGQFVIDLTPDLFVDPDYPTLVPLGINSTWLENGSSHPADPWPGPFDLGSGQGWAPDIGATIAAVDGGLHCNLLADWQPPRYRFIKPLHSPQRQYPRDDGLAASTKRSWPLPTSKQFGLRRGPVGTFW